MNPIILETRELTKIYRRTAAGTEEMKWMHD